MRVLIIAEMSRDHKTNDKKYTHHLKHSWEKLKIIGTGVKLKHVIRSKKVS